MPETPASPTIFVLFGATGDLAARMVLPAFYTLAQKNLLPKEWRLIGNGRGDVAHEDFRAKVRESLGDDVEDAEWEAFSKNLLFAGGGFDETGPGSLLDVIRDVEDELDDEVQPNFIHYLAIPPVAFEPTAKALKKHGLTDHARVVFEKPYGTSPDDFRQLDATVHDALDEEQVFRIDHFLGKEATQNLHVLRFANQTFSTAWHGHHVAAVQIDVPETLDVANRAGFYDATGAMMDMVVTHLMQVAAEIAMEPPLSLDAQDLQDARESVIAAFRPLSPDDVVLGQFEGYRDLEGVADDSQTDTFCAVRLWVDTDRWHGVPFLLRSGKRLGVSEQRVSLVMKPVEGPLPQSDEPSTISLSLAGSGSVEADFVLKRPGAGIRLAHVRQTLELDRIEDADPLPPYVALLYDVLTGDRSLFTSSAGLEHAWRVADPVLKNKPTPQPYEPGSMGPAAADELAAPHGWLISGDGTDGKPQQ
ncbi:glucose-6-phosphate dehydrogenase [Kineosporia sp. NBRC 101731]|uniref:glucose-6-phosphate dehydrogenase n=1 Tax=Kineosporia sp. NBRC 101731 TaxID=3032199 RepID=UPI0024A5399F|nr:glucose-6-phosphate dehydrogenase [Kineosporia sp. NBRC 101731]GLY26685.1 glucose-6-phosphate 1-dehydrogenase [Kineosporia sp. NBRC 101731]